MKYKLAIFDLDGTILDTLQDLKNSLNFALSLCSLPSISDDKAKSILGNGMRRYVESGVPENTPKNVIEKVFEEFNKHYAVHCKEHTVPYEGILHLMEELKKQGRAVAVVSNKSDYGVQILCKENFKGLADYAAGAKDGIRRKPAPDMVEAVLQKFGLKNSEAVYIGDSEVDIDTAANSHMDCLSVCWGFRTPEQLIQAGASRLIYTVDELLKAILE